MSESSRIVGVLRGRVQAGVCEDEIVTELAQLVESTARSTLQLLAVELQADGGELARRVGMVAEGDVGAVLAALGAVLVEDETKEMS